MSIVVDPREISAAKAKQVGPLELVNEKKSYTAVLQLGSSRRWRNFGSGKWERDASKERPGTTERSMRHCPAIHKIGPFEGSTINGLIAEHNEWIKANDEGKLPEGTVNRQLLISAIEESQDPPLDAPSDNRLTALSLKEIVGTAVREALGAVLEALRPNKGSRKPDAGGDNSGSP